MRRIALAANRPWLLASLVAGISYFFADVEALADVWQILWKGAGVAFLAAYAFQRSQNLDGILIAAALAFGAAGDMALELSLLSGGALFAVGHIFAIALYWRNRRVHLTVSQKLAAIALLVLTPLIAGLLAWPAPNWTIATLYSLCVSAMAAAAWLSRFPRYRVGIGALLFVVSDLLIFGREAGRLPGNLAGMLIWPLYYCGQFLIATGVVQTLRRERN